MPCAAATPLLPERARLRAEVLGAAVDVLTWEEALAGVMASAANDSRYVCVCNVHSVVTATLDLDFRRAVNDADMATPDGAPVAWAMRRLGHDEQQRISGPDLMWALLQHAERAGWPVYFYGSTERTLVALQRHLATAFPQLQIAGMHAPPTRMLTEKEDGKVVELINRSGACLVFVGLGCPKQERWMAAQRGRLNAVMVGVGAAFDYHAGTIVRAPLWMQRSGLEWLHRLASEPRRLWKRYLVTNSVYLWLAARQLLSGPRS